MTNPMFNPPQNYSGVTIQISNPAVNVGQGYAAARIPNSAYGNIGFNPAYAQGCYPAQYCICETPGQTEYAGSNYVTNPAISGYGSAYPAEYYINNYGAGNQKKNDALNNNEINSLNREFVGKDSNENVNAQYTSDEQNSDNVKTGNSSENNNDNSLNDSNNSKLDEKYVSNSVRERESEVNSKNDLNSDERSFAENRTSGENVNSTNYVNESDLNGSGKNNDYVASYRQYGSDSNPPQKDEDMTKSQNIITELDERNAAIEENNKNTKETKIVALTDEYIKSLENYLNNPNNEIRLMASKEILTRLDEDKERYNDAALNALLNKMLQDPSKLIRVAALSAFASQLASGNDYTVQLLHNIQNNPNADKEDVLQAADILLKMSAGTEIKRIPNPAVKDDKQQSVNQ